MNTKGTFLNRLKYGKHKFHNGVETYAMPHINPDGTIGGWVAESSVVDEECYISPDAEVFEYAQVLGEATLLGSTCVSGFAVVKDKAILDDESHVTDDALVEGTARIAGATHLGGRSHVDWGLVDTDKMHDYLLQLQNQKIEKARNVRMA
jgi:UDP-3-O-[3-hydroxymyristoyl] glucosamine N-acyltransferase